MPYIEKHRRKLHPDMLDAGELNYVITYIIKEYLAQRTFSYRTMNEIIGALESAKLEFYRRIVAPYEKEKMKKNGDCYD